MSIRIMAKVWEESTHSSGTLLVLLALADFSDDEGTSYPSIATIARKSRLSPRQVNRAIADLEKSGELIVAESKGVRTQGGHTNLFKIVLHKRGDVGVRGDKMSGVTICPKRGDTHVTLTVSEPSVINTPVVPRGDETEFSEVEEVSEGEQAPAPVAYPVIPNLSKEKTPRIAADHPTFSQDWERIWNRYSEAKPSTPKSQALAKAKKLTLDQWHTFKETFPSWAEEWERKAAAGESKYIPHLTTHLQRGAYTEPFRGGKGIVPASTQKPGFGPPEGFTTPFPNEPDRIGKYGQAHMVVLGDLGVVTRDESLNYLEAVASSSLQILMGKPALTADYEYVMVIDERVRVWHDEKGGKAKVREYLTKKKAEQGNDDE